MEKNTYLYIVYENYKHYKDFNKFHEIALTTSQVEVREKYIDKDEYKVEFFLIPPGFADRVFKYIQNKFIRSTFPFNVRDGELQTTCTEFINKCNQIRQEKVQSGYISTQNTTLSL